jgi:hypothetical protein
LPELALRAAKSLGERAQGRAIEVLATKTTSSDADEK